MQTPYGLGPLDLFTQGDNFSSVDSDEILRRRIVLLMEAKGTKQTKLAHAARRGPSWASMFLRGDRGFPMESLADVAALLDRTIEQMFAPLSHEEANRSAELQRSFRKKKHAR